MMDPGEGGGDVAGEAGPTVGALRDASPIRWTLLILGSLLAWPLPDRAEAQVVSVEEWQEVVASLAATVLDHYVLPDLAASLADSIAVWHPPSDGPLQRSDFVESLLADLRRWSGDQHFLLFHPSLPPSPVDRRVIEVMSGQVCWADASEARDTWVLGGIVRLPRADRLPCAMRPLLDASRVILDLRSCSGGSRESVARLLGYFLEEPTHFATYHERGRAPRAAYSEDVERGTLGHTSLAVIIGPDTASGCEAIAYHLQRLARAIVVGSRSAGAAHAVRTFDLARGYRALVPVVRSADPTTGGDWEGVGVQPDIDVPPGDALDRAVRALGGPSPDR